MPSLAELLDPAPGRICVQVKAAEEMKGGLYLPVDTVRSMHEVKPVQGKIVAMGEEAPDDSDWELNIGDLVIFGKYSGVEIRYRPPSDADVKTGPMAQPRPPEERIIILGRKDILTRVKDESQASNMVVKG